MIDKVLKVVASINAILLMVSGSALDSESWIPTIVCAVSTVVLILLIPSIRRWAEE